jgi:thioredoxin 2
MILRCPQCGSQNRIPENAGGKKVVCGKCKTQLAPPAPAGSGHPEPVTDATFREAVARGPVVVDFWAPWCGPCRTVGPIIDELAAARRDIRFAKLNVDDNPRTSLAFGVQGIPAILFFRDGEERGRVVGAVPRPKLEAAIRQYLG